jgi:hypothetical protein
MGVQFKTENSKLKTITARIVVAYLIQNSKLFKLLRSNFSLSCLFTRSSTRVPTLLGLQFFVEFSIDIVVVAFSDNGYFYDISFDAIDDSELADIDPFVFVAANQMF